MTVTRFIDRHLMHNCFIIALAAAAVAAAKSNLQWPDPTIGAGMSSVYSIILRELEVSVW
jgi:hypothetical protein